jgi:hypothetical protein
VHPGELPGQVARPVGIVRRDKGFGERLPPGLPVGPALHSTGADQRGTRSGIFRLQQRPASLRNVQTGTVDGTGSVVFILFLIVFWQTACALAVAESQLKFEHRDLHWGNVLLTSVDKNKTLRYRLNDKDVEVETHGVEIAIIDFTLSRIEFDGVVIFNDLSLDNELFAAQGDYQFEIYRLMQKSNG